MRGCVVLWTDGASCVRRSSRVAALPNDGRRSGFPVHLLREREREREFCCSTSAFRPLEVLHFLLLSLSLSCHTFAHKFSRRGIERERKGCSGRDGNPRVDASSQVERAREEFSQKVTSVSRLVCARAAVLSCVRAREGVLSTREERKVTSAGKQIKRPPDLPFGQPLDRDNLTPLTATESGE